MIEDEEGGTWAEFFAMLKVMYFGETLVFFVSAFGFILLFLLLANPQ